MPDEISSVKPGYKTTEFWITSIGQLIGILMASGAITPGSSWDKIAGLAVIALGQASYAASRGQAKSGQ